MKSCRLIKEDYEEIKRMVGMRQAAEFYGFPVDRKRRCICPFHRDRHPSLKIYPHNLGYYCFSCGAGGDVITFVGKLYGLDNESAARKLIEDFHLPIHTEGLSYREKRERDKRVRQRRELDAFTDRAGKVLLEYRKRLCEAVRQPYSPYFEEGLEMLTIVEYWLSCLDECPQEMKEDEGMVKRLGAIEQRLAGWDVFDTAGAAIS